MELDADLFRRIAGDAALPLPAEDPTDRRASGRVWLGRRTTLTRTSREAAAPIGVVVRDLSPCGVGILTTTPLDVGETFLLALSESAGDASVMVECRALWRKSGEYGDGSSFIVGAEFVRRRA